MTAAPAYTPYHPDRPDLNRLEAELLSLYAHISAATYRFLTLVNEFDDAGGWHGEGVKSLAHWLSWRCGIGLNAAREQIRVAKALPGLPAITGAFESGRLSFSKVRALTRVATAENEERLLGVALNTSASQTERIVRGLRQCLTLEEANAAHRARALSVCAAEDGTYVVRGRLTAEAGALLIEALDAARSSVSDDETTEPADDGAAASRADALERLAESFLAGERKPLSGGERHTVLIHVNPEALRQDENDVTEKDVTAVTPPAPIARTDHDACLSRETARRLSCDAALVAVYENTRGEPLAIGRKTRAIPPAIGRALKIRDGGCRFPGCSQRRYVDAHHIEHWADGGETALDNLVLLCRHHHRLVHEEGFQVVRTSRGPVFYTPSGAELLPAGGTEGDTRYRGNAQTLCDDNVEGIGPGSLVPEHFSEQLDLHAAVDRVLTQGHSAQAGRRLNSRERGNYRYP